MIASLALGLAVAAAESSPPAGKYVTAELIAESAEPKPGSTIWIGIRMVPRPGWHGYWSNPGDAGIAPTVEWTAPAGVTFGPLVHPAPTLLSAGGVDSYVHSGPHILLSRMTVAPQVAPGTPLPVSADLGWAACTETMCVPEKAALKIQLVAGNGGKGAEATVLEGARRQLPRPGDHGSYSVEGRRLVLALPPSMRLDATNARFFPDESGYYRAAKARAAADGGRVTIAAPTSGPIPAKLSGVVSDGRNAYRLSFTRALNEPAMPAPVGTAGDDSPRAASRPVVLQQTPTHPIDTARSQRAAPPHPLPWLAAFAVLAGALAFLAMRRRH